MIGGSFESLEFVKNLERLSKKQSNNQVTDQSGTVDFSCQSSGVNVSPQKFSDFSRLIPQCRGWSGSMYTTSATARFPVGMT